MKRPNLQTVLFNGAGVAIAVTVVGYVVQSFFTHETVETCTARYPAGHQFALQTAEGKSLSPIEMQAQTGARQWGLLKNARVVEASDRNARYLQVALESTDNEENEAQNGIGMVWQPSGLSGSTAACLSYRVFLPKDFAFNNEGYLPGIYGGADIASLDAEKVVSGFAARFGWQKNGEPGIAVRSAAAPNGKWVVGRGAVLPVGRWVDIQQEVAMNDPGKANGFMRVWIDGQLKLEAYKLNLGTDEPSSLAGVVSDIHYARGTQESLGSRLTISPFIMQWQQVNKMAGNTTNPN